MSVLDFPTSPTNGQYYNGFIWNAANETWDSSFAPRPATIPVTGYNAIINGAGDIWQRGGAVSVADGGYGPDRWRRAANGSGGACAFFQVPNSTADTDATKSPSQFYMRYQWTSAPTSQTYNVLQQPIEDVRTFANQTVTLSFWAKSPTNASMVIRPVLHQFFGAGGSTDVVLNGANITVTSSWQKFSATFNVPAITGKTIGANSWLGVEFDFFNFLNTAFAFDYTNVQLESGPVPTEFRRNAPNIVAELEACRRYYQRYAGADDYFPPQSPVQIDASNRPEIILFYTEKRVLPTITVNNVGQLNMSALTTSANNGVTSFLGALVGSGKTGSNLFFAGTWTAYVPCNLYVGATSSIEISAEL